MESSIILNGKKFISARRGGEIAGYSSDYVGQLCRAQKVEAQMIGRVWFVSEESLVSYKKEQDRLSEEMRLMMSLPTVSEPSGLPTPDLSVPSPFATVNISTPKTSAFSILKFQWVGAICLLVALFGGVYEIQKTQSLSSIQTSATTFFSDARTSTSKSISATKDNLVASVGTVASSVSESYEHFSAPIIKVVANISDNTLSVLNYGHEKVLSGIIYLSNGITTIPTTLVTQTVAGANISARGLSQGIYSVSKTLAKAGDVFETYTNGALTGVSEKVLSVGAYASRGLGVAYSEGASQLAGIANTFSSVRGGILSFGSQMSSGASLAFDTAVLHITDGAEAFESKVASVGDSVTSLFDNPYTSTLSSIALATQTEKHDVSEGSVEVSSDTKSEYLSSQNTALIFPDINKTIASIDAQMSFNSLDFGIEENLVAVSVPKQETTSSVSVTSSEKSQLAVAGEVFESGFNAGLAQVASAESSVESVFARVGESFQSAGRYTNTQYSMLKQDMYTAGRELAADFVSVGEVFATAMVSTSKGIAHIYSTTLDSISSGLSQGWDFATTKTNLVITKVSSGVSSVGESISGSARFLTTPETYIAIKTRLFGPNSSDKVAVNSMSVPPVPKSTAMGIAVVPKMAGQSTEEVVRQIKDSFSDEVEVHPDSSGTSGIIKPVFKKVSSDEYVYVLVPINQ